MIVEEYIKTNGMTQGEFAKFLGVSYATINRHIRLGTQFNKPHVVDKLSELGIEVERFRAKGKYALSEYIYQEKLHIDQYPIGEIYCYSIERVNEVTNYLNKRRIGYYTRYTDYCWIIKYDATYREESWNVK